MWRDAQEDVQLTLFVAREGSECVDACDKEGSFPSIAHSRTRKKQGTMMPVGYERISKRRRQMRRWRGDCAGQMTMEGGMIERLGWRMQ